MSALPQIPPDLQDLLVVASVSGGKDSTALILEAALHQMLVDRGCIP